MAEEQGRRFTTTQLSDLRRKLETSRTNLLSTERDAEREGLTDLSEEETGEISHVRTHAADLGSDEFQRDLMLSLADDEIREIQDIEDALIKIQKETYGICEECAGEIPFERLEVLPYARYCGPCEMKLEKRRKDQMRRSLLT
jgi:DnaK suppressor protein